MKTIIKHILKKIRSRFLEPEGFIILLLYLFVFPQIRKYLEKFYIEYTPSFIKDYLSDVIFNHLLFILTSISFIILCIIFTTLINVIFQ
jgi:hypothetical protein